MDVGTWGTKTPGSIMPPLSHMLCEVPHFSLDSSTVLFARGPLNEFAPPPTIKARCNITFKVPIQVDILIAVFSNSKPKID